MKPMIEKVVKIADDIVLLGCYQLENGEIESLTVAEWRQLAADLRAMEHWAKHGPKLLKAAEQLLASTEWHARTATSPTVYSTQTENMRAALIAAAAPKETLHSGASRHHHSDSGFVRDERRVGA